MNRNPRRRGPPPSSRLRITIGKLDEKEAMHTPVGTATPKTPRDATDGFSTGIRLMSQGVASGISSFVVMPLLGAHEDGLYGFAKGIVVGSASAIAAVGGGTVTGVGQILWGIANTPYAIMCSHEDKVWNPDTHEWYMYRLDDEARRILTSDDDQFSSEATTCVKDTKLYDLLGVRFNATDAEIKKAYRRLAIQWHPDKNLADPAKASQQFQELSSAYQVLSDRRNRAAYDARGHDTTTPTFTDDQLYAMTMQWVFGNEHFENFVGDVNIMPNDFFGHDEVSKRVQNRREVQCAVFLRDLLDDAERPSPFTDKQKHANFLATVAALAKDLSSTKFGASLLRVVGVIYEEQALKHLGFRNSAPAGLGLHNIAKSARKVVSKYRVVASYISAFQSVVKAAEVNYHAMKAQDNRMKDGDTSSRSGEQEQLLHQTFGSVLEIGWHCIVSDVEATIRGACFKLLKDSAVSTLQRDRRAKNLLIMGEIFQASGQPPEAGLAEILNKLLQFKQSMKPPQHTSAA
ncbi:hypothetical protein DYB26_000041 [Aphanomyces astaci]|uniref:J domain-containing protein n=1 Tax=Aphanomyces astaci TaxID=112090 RepID=A0A418FDC3_APHAT|nr:hypothetical protein DYB26_000041 [Aphanomyces astaci]